MPNKQEKPLMDHVFDKVDCVVDGVDGLMDRIFGSSKPQPTPAKPREVRIKIKSEQLARIAAGEELRFKLPGEVITLVCPAKYSREHVCELLEKGKITGDEAKALLLERL